MSEQQTIKNYHCYWTSTRVSQSHSSNMYLLYSRQVFQLSVDGCEINDWRRWLCPANGTNIRRHGHVAFVEQNHVDDRLISRGKQQHRVIRAPARSLKTHAHTCRWMAISRLSWVSRLAPNLFLHLFQNGTIENNEADISQTESYSCHRINNVETRTGTQNTGPVSK